MSKYGVSSDPYFPVLELNNLLRKSPYTVRIQENTDQKKLRIWTLSRSDLLYWFLEYATYYAIYYLVLTVYQD